MLRQNQRALNRAMRDLDRERQRLEQQEKKIIADIKKMAKQGQMVRRVLIWYVSVTDMSMKSRLSASNILLPTGCCEDHG